MEDTSVSSSAVFLPSNQTVLGLFSRKHLWVKGEDGARGDPGAPQGGDVVGLRGRRAGCRVRVHV